jgi:DNA-binding NarL/FixJ family response regulator
MSCRALRRILKKMKPLRLLLVDDNPRTRRALKALLSVHPEIEIVGEASNGREAIAAVETTRPGVILMDVQMPVMDGLEATRRIKSRWPQVRVIALTMYPIYEEGARSAGADAFLVKGRPSEELLSTITAANNLAGAVAASSLE